MGVGKSGEKIDKDKFSIKFGDFIVAEKWKNFKNTMMQKLKEYMKWDSINIEANLNLG